MFQNVHKKDDIVRLQSVMNTTFTSESDYVNAFIKISMLYVSISKHHSLYTKGLLSTKVLSIEILIFFPFQFSVIPFSKGKAILRYIGYPEIPDDPETVKERIADKYVCILIDKLKRSGDPSVQRVQNLLGQLH